MCYSIQFELLFIYEFKGLKYPESAALFEETNRFIKKCGKIISFVAMKLVLNVVILLQCIGCFIKYIFTDMGNDAFVLPIPMWLA